MSYRSASIAYSPLHPLPSDSGRFDALPVNYPVDGIQALPNIMKWSRISATAGRHGTIRLAVSPLYAMVEQTPRHCKESHATRVGLERGVRRVQTPLPSPDLFTPCSTPDSTSAHQRFNWDPQESHDPLVCSEPARNIIQRLAKPERCPCLCCNSARGLKKGVLEVFATVLDQKDPLGGEGRAEVMAKPRYPPFDLPTCGNQIIFEASGSYRPGGLSSHQHMERSQNHSLMLSGSNRYMQPHILNAR